MFHSRQSQSGKMEDPIVKDITQDMTTPRLYTTCSTKVNFTDNSELKYRIVRFVLRYTLLNALLKYLLQYVNIIL